MAGMIGWSVGSCDREVATWERGASGSISGK